MAWSNSKDIVIEKAWARGSIGIDRPGAVYMTIHNTGDVAITLNGIKTDLATMPKFHRTKTRADGMSKMEPTGDVIIAAGEMVRLQPGGLHIMLMGLQRPMKQGDSFDMTLIFSDGGEVISAIPIYGLASSGPDG